MRTKPEVLDHGLAGFLDSVARSAEQRFALRWSKTIGLVIAGVRARTRRYDGRHLVNFLREGELLLEILQVD